MGKATAMGWDWPLILAVLSGLCAVVCFLKDKPGLGSVGLIGLIPALAALLVWFPLTGALRYAKPTSFWARHSYEERHMTAARKRFPQDRADDRHEGFAESQGADGDDMWGAPVSHREDGRPDDGAPGSPGGDRMDDGLFERSAISRFIAAARAEGLIDDETSHKLRGLLARPPPTPPAAQPTSAEPPRAAASITSVDTPTTTPTTGLVASGPPQPVPSSPPVRSKPHPLVGTVTRIWEAALSDIALHGLAYLGVVLTFVAVLGFLLFSFADVPDAAQPFVELFIALIFFGWAWFLRRLNADRVADGLELIGGMVLPLIVFASMVDNAPFPPDLEGSSLIVALTVSAVLLAVSYGLVTLRYVDSTLRYLVGPMVWLGALTLGFAFKGDEALAGDAITRLVSPQPALASAAIALTLVVCQRWPRHRLTAATVRATLVAVPVAYLLTVALSVAEDWDRTWPLVLLGIGTLVSVELLAGWYRRQPVAALLRPVLLAATLLPLLPALGVGWTGLLLAVVYVVVFELAGRDPTDSSTVPLLALAGVAGGAAMSLVDPWPAVITFAVLVVWAHVRRLQSPADLEGVFLAAAAALPIGVGYGLVQLLTPGAAWLTMSFILVAVTAGVRWRRIRDMFWPYWLTGAAMVVAVGAVATWNGGDRSDALPVVAILVAAVVVATAPRWPVLRLWTASALAALALAMDFETLEVPTGPALVIWAGLGLAIVAAAGLVRRHPAGHVAAIGHIIATAAVIPLADGAVGATVLGAWCLGWVVSVIGAEIGGDTLTALLARVSSSLLSHNPRLVAATGWVAPVLMVVALPPAVITTAGLWEEFAAHRAWTGGIWATLALTEAVAARRTAGRRPLSRVLSIAAVVSSMIGVAVAAPEPWVSIYAAAAVIALGAVLGRDLRPRWLVGLAWLMSGVMILLLAERAGVPTGSLHVVSLAWGTTMLVGGLLFDDARAGRRSVGEGIRVDWVRLPVGLGALVVPASLGAVFTLPPSVYGWWALGAAIGYLGIAFLMRVGAVTAPAYALAVVAGIALPPWDVLEAPWLLVTVAAPMLAISAVAARLQPARAATDGWLRWDLAPFVVAHVVGVLILALGIDSDTVVPATLAVGSLALVVGLWRRHRVWIDIANGLVLVAALDAGSGWPALALAGTSLRGSVAAWRTTGWPRASYQALAVVSVGFAWLTFLDWREVSAIHGVSSSGLIFGGVGLVAAVLVRWGRVRVDTMAWWGGLGVTGVGVAAAVGANADGPGVQGPWLALGILMLGAALEVAWRKVDPMLRYLAVATTGASWAALVAGVGWSRTTTVATSIVVFGALTLVVPEIVRLRPVERTPGSAAGSGLVVARAWTGLGALGVVSAILQAEGVGEIAGGDVWVATGLAALSLAAARGADPLEAGWLREASMVLGVLSLTRWATAAGWSDLQLGAGVVLLAVLATLAGLAVWRRPGSVWVRPLVVLAAAANVEAVVLAVSSWPQRSLLVTVLLAIGAQAIAIGLIHRITGVLAAGPPLVGLAFVLAVAESVTGTAQWYTAPVAVVLLCEVEILREAMRNRPDGGVDHAGVVVGMEWAAIGLLAAPPLVEMFTTRIAFGLVAIAIAAAILLWGIATRVRRRVIAALSLTTGSAVLLIFAAAAGSAPSSAAFWIVAAGLGFAVMMVAGIVEAYRARKGRAMARLDRLMEGWE